MATEKLLLQAPRLDREEDDKHLFARQVYAMARKFPLMMLRNKGYIIAAILVPFVFIGISYVMSSVIASSINLGADPTTSSTTVPLNVPALYNATLTDIFPYLRNTTGGTAIDDAAFTALQNAMAAQFPAGQADLSKWRSFADVSALQDTLGSRNNKLKAQFGLALRQLANVNASQALVSTSLIVNASLGAFASGAWANALHTAVTREYGGASGSSAFTLAELVLYGLQDNDSQRRDIFATLVASIMPPFVTFGIMFMVPFFSSSSVEDRAKGRYEHLLLAGMHPRAYRLGMFVGDASTGLFTATAIMGLLYALAYPPLVQSVPGLHWITMYLGMIVVVTFSYVLSMPFKSSENAGNVLGFGSSIIVFIPYFIVSMAFQNNVPDAVSYVLALLTPSYGIMRVLQQAASGVADGQPLDTWDKAMRSGDSLIPISWAIMAAQAVLYYLATMAVEEGWLRRDTDAHVDDSLYQTALQEHAGAWQADDDGVAHMFDDAAAADLAVDARGVGVAFHAPEASGDKTILALRAFGLAVRRGEVLSLLGPNGAGKSTFIKTLTGEQPAHAGEMRVLGERVDTESGRRRLRGQLGYVPQFNVLFDTLTVADNIDMWCLVRGLSPTERTQTMDFVLEQLGDLRRFRDEPVKSLSGGNQRKVQLALAIVGNPALLVLDEPTTGMDPATKRSIWRVVRSMCRVGGATVLMTTHSMEEAEALSDHIAVNIGGHLQVYGQAWELKRRYAVGTSVHLSVGRAEEERGDIADQLRTTLHAMLADNDRDDGIVEVEAANGVVRATVMDPEVSAKDVLARLEQFENRVEKFTVTPTTLEQVFLSLVRRANHHEP